MSAIRGFEVVVCGGGIAGVEGLLRVRRLAGDRLRVTLVSLDRDLVYRPLAVRAPFAGSGVRRYPLERVAAHVGARWVRDRLSSVDHTSRTVQTEAGATLSYDALLLAIGAQESSPYQHADVFSDRGGEGTLRAIVKDIEMGELGSVAFVLPHEWVWPLPLYELALITAERARSMDRRPRITFITAEARPLQAFGQAAGEAIVRLLREAGIRLHTGAVAQVPAPRVVRFGATQLEAERIVTLPKLTGPAIRGLPAGTRWFVPINERCVVPATDGRVFAAATPPTFPSNRAESAPSKPTPPPPASFISLASATARPLCDR